MIRLRRRLGMTLLETLLALVLLAACAAGLLSLASGAAASGARAAQLANRAAAADAVLRAIGDDLLAWDRRLDPPGDPRPRVRLTQRGAAHSLRITLRAPDGRLVHHLYEIDDRRSLRRRLVDPQSPSNSDAIHGDERPPLLSPPVTLHAEHDPELARLVVTVSFGDRHDLIRSRVYRLPIEVDESAP